MGKFAVQLIVIVALSLPELTSAQTPPQKVVVTYSSRSIASIDLFVAQERGFFREEGLDPQLVQVRATAAIAALVSGEVHALGSVPIVIVARDKYKMNILASAIDEFSSLQNGLAVLDRTSAIPW